MAAGPLTPPPPPPPPGQRRRSLTDVRAKSRPRHDPERLTTHSRTVHAMVTHIRDRIASTGILATEPAFWTRILHAALLHDAGKIAESFQQQLEPGGPLWGERHEVLSLAYVDLLAPTARWNTADRLMIATLVASHHRPLHAPSSLGGGKTSLARLYNQHTDWEEAFTRTTTLQHPLIQVPRGLHQQFLAWLAGYLTLDPPAPHPSDPPLAQRAKTLLQEVLTAWEQPVTPHAGLLAVLAQGALTLADHAGSAHEQLQTHMPLHPHYLTRLPHPPHPHQQAAATTDGHLVLAAPTGSGKTEAGLAWAARQMPTMPGQPRLIWTLPYRASLNAIRQRLTHTLDPAPGDTTADIGLLHGALARTLLSEALADDCAPNPDTARKARARAAAMRLFTQRVRVATPHQLLSAALAGPTHSSVLLEQANALFVLDELHAYDPQTFGRLCAAMRLWERLGSRFAVLSATLAPPLLTLITESVEHPVTLHTAPHGTAPVRHRLTLDDTPLTHPASIDRLRSWLNDGHSVLAVTNTVTTAQTLFTALTDDAHTAAPSDPHAALLLHSRFKNRDRDAIEHALLHRHPERTPGSSRLPAGLVVATQTVEVSLQLDLDRGAVENAPIEAVAQRAGRVNRRGLHPDGPVEFRVHATQSHRPYEKAAVQAAWDALTTLTADGTDTLSEQDIDRLLHLAYDTPWGKEWATLARDARDAFTADFLTFTDPFHDRSEYAQKLSERFDTIEVLHRDDTSEYQHLTTGPDTDPLLASGLLIPLRYSQLATYNATYDQRMKIHLIDGEYDSHLGLRPPTPPETIL
ncbi:CRISPR-associated helicase Cas3' [Streptomyces californicus]|uniref:CRISPR-associated helicase Cas3' n=1 Tax=Streptomyces californicus TaxID=67351 RepID=UPI0036B596F7